MTGETTQARCPETVLGWIPWYGDVGLTSAQQGAVESHAAECAECRAEIDMIMGALFQVDAELPDPDRVFQAVTQRIEDRAATAAASENTEGSAGFGADELAEQVHVVKYESMEDLEQLAEWALEEASPAEAQSTHKSGGLIEGPWPGSSLWAAAAACFLISLGALAGALYAGGGSLVSSKDGAPSEWTQEEVADPSYSLATDVGGSDSARTTSLVDVVFREDTSMSQISAFLREMGAEIVSGPSSMGVFRLRLEAEASGPASRVAESRFLERLKNENNGLAIFAEAVP